MKKRTANRITAWGPSRLAVYDECPAKAKYKHIDKLPDPGSAAMDRGTEIHDAAASYIWGRVTKLHGDLKHPKVKRLLAQLKAAATKKLVRTELELAIDRAWQKCKWFAPETYARVKLDVVMFSSDGTSADVIDWKTGKFYTAEQKPEYVDALFQYSVILMSCYPTLQSVESRLVFTDAGQEVKVPEGCIQRANLASGQQHWDRKAKPMLTDTLFKPRPGRACTYCPFSQNKDGPCQY